MIKSRLNFINQIAYIIFFAAILCEFFVSFSGYLIGGYKESYIILAGMGCFVVSILIAYDYKKLLTKSILSKKQILCELIVYVLLILFAFCCFFFQKSALVLRICLILIASHVLQKRIKRNVVRDIVTIFFYGTLAFMLIYGILSALGHHNTLSLTQNFRSEEETRYCFGFFHPNGFSLFYCRVIVLGIYLYLDKMKIWLLFIMAAVTSVPMIMSGSKMGLAILFMLFILCLIYKLIKQNNSLKIIYIIGILEYFVIVALLIIIRFKDILAPKESMLGKALVWFNDNIMTGRMHSMRRSFKEYSLNLFGYGNTISTTENGYVNAIFSEGVIFFLLFMIITLWLLRQMYKNKDALGMIVVIVMVAYLFSESFMAYFNKNLIWIMLIGYVTKNDTIFDRKNSN